MNASETWGHKAILDPLSSHFKHFFDLAGLHDFAPPCPRPTWKNGRLGTEGISKRLDHFLLSSDLIPLLKSHRSWIQPADVSDHLPIYLEWNKSLSSFNYPFKFNRSWLADLDLVLWLSKRWPIIHPPSPLNDLDCLVNKLRALKGDVKAWSMERESLMKADSVKLDL